MNSTYKFRSASLPKRRAVKWIQFDRIHLSFSADSAPKNKCNSICRINRKLKEQHAANMRRTNDAYWRGRRCMPSGCASCCASYCASSWCNFHYQSIPFDIRIDCRDAFFQLSFATPQPSKQGSEVNTTDSKRICQNFIPFHSEVLCSIFNCWLIASELNELM